MTDNSKKIRLKIARLEKVNKGNERTIKKLQHKLDRIQHHERRKKILINNTKTRQFTKTRQTQKRRSFLSRLSQSVTNLSKKIPRTTRKTSTIEIFPKKV